MHKPLLLLLALSAPMALAACNGDDDNSGYAVDAGPKVFGNEPVDSGPKDATTDATLSDADTDAATDATTTDATADATPDATADAADSATDAADAAAE
jgi:hypothetical protein